MNKKICIWLVILTALIFQATIAQPGIKWSDDGNGYYRYDNGSILKYNLPGNEPSVIVAAKSLIPGGERDPLRISYFKINETSGKVLLFANTRKVWRLNTRGDYWILDQKTGKMNQLGKGLPEASLMFAKISPDGNHAAYVSNNNIYTEELATGKITRQTSDGTLTIINGTFDWAYEEEFFCRDGFRWSPDSKTIAYWQIDASGIKKFNMINNTDSIYPVVIPIEYPKAGEKPSSARIGVVGIAGGKTTWMDIPGDPSQNYIVRMEFIPSNGNLLLQQLNRKQNNSKLYICTPSNGESKMIFEESDEAWVDLNTGDGVYSIDYTNNFVWMNGGRDVLWTSEKDGWRHLFQVSLEGKAEKLLTSGSYDIITFQHLDPKTGFVYFTASPENPVQQYLYRVNVKRPDRLERMSPQELNGTHNYSVSPGGKYAYHMFSNYYTYPSFEFISLSSHKPLNPEEGIAAKIDSLRMETTTEFFRIKIPGGIELDGWMAKPSNFDPKKKYPVLFYVYTEPWGATVSDSYGVDQNSLYEGNLTEDGYIYMSVDNRGTPHPRGRAWRKSIYRKIGQINIDDQAAAAREILKWHFVDPERIAVYGWSGGGTATLNLMFRYPEIYKTGISVAGESNMLTYDNIYQERYMGLPQEAMEDYIRGSAITHAGNLEGNLLIIHGTGDDNVHYQNAEMLVNELVKHKKLFQIMPYPNRTHSISEGEGTSEHLVKVFTDYLRRNCPPGPR